MITPIFIQIIFWIGVAACVILGIIQMVQGTGMRYGGGSVVLSGLLTLLLGPLVVRIYCELLIVIFKMNETLTDIRNELRQKEKNMD